MAWGEKDKDRKGKTTEELFGMSEEELKAQILGTKELPAKLEALQTETNTKFTDLTTKMDNLISTVGKALETRTGSESNSEMNEGDEGRKRTGLRRWDEDADGAFLDRTKPLAGLALSAKADIVKDQVLRRLSYHTTMKDGREVDGPLHKEIEEELAKQPLEARINPEFVKNCYNVVVGRHADEIQNDAIKGSGKFFVESVGSSSGAGSHGEDNSKKKPEDRLSAKELDYAKKLRITPEQYLAQKEKLEYV